MTTDITVPHLHDTHLDKEYGGWLSSLKMRYVNAQTRALVKINAEKLLWKWQLGRELVLRKAEDRWGSGVVEQLSFDLQAAFPGEQGFSPQNLWFIKKWYLYYSEKLYQTGRELDSDDLWCADGMPMPRIFSLVPWRHHVEIVMKCKTVEEALYYINHTIEESWSRNTLMNCIKSDLYHKSGKAVTNFADKLQLPQAELAQEITKEVYDFGFVELPKGYKETQLEDALSQQMARFLLELGTGFAFVGRQKEIIIAGRSRKIDLLFYHIYLRCYVVLELKVVPFEPEFAGKLNYYVAAVDEAIRREGDNPTIGLLICSALDKTDVQLAFRGVTTPLGVAAYENVQLREIASQLPTLEQLQDRIRLLEQELRSKR